MVFVQRLRMAFIGKHKKKKGGAIKFILWCSYFVGIELYCVRTVSHASCMSFSESLEHFLIFQKIHFLFLNQFRLALSLFLTNGHKEYILSTVSHKPFIHYTSLAFLNLLIRCFVFPAFSTSLPLILIIQDLGRTLVCDNHDHFLNQAH